MTRRQAGILAQLVRGPYTTLDLAIALDETTAHIRADVEKLETMGVVEWTVDGWVLTKEVAA